MATMFVLCEKSDAEHFEKFTTELFENSKFYKVPLLSLIEETHQDLFEKLIHLNLFLELTKQTFEISSTKFIKNNLFFTIIHQEKEFFKIPFSCPLFPLFVSNFSRCMS